MRTLHLMAIAVTLMAACGSPERSAPAETEQAAEEAAPARAAPPSLYDAEGRLLPSTDTVAGLTLPLGLELVEATDRRHHYISRVPLAKLLGYFGPRLFTAEVDPVGEGAVYRRARPLEARGGIVYLDVSILPRGRNRTGIIIHELPPPPVELPTRASDRERHRQHVRVLD